MASVKRPAESPSYGTLKQPTTQAAKTEGPPLGSVAIFRFQPRVVATRDTGGVSLVTADRYPDHAGGSGSLYTCEPCRISLVRAIRRK